MKKKTLYRILGGLVGLILLLIILKAAGVVGKDEGLKVSVDNASNKNIIEVVSASGKIYPEVEVKISSDVSGQVTDLPVQEGDSVKKGQVLVKIYADIYGSMRDKAVAALSQSQAQLANVSASLNAFKAKLEQAKAAYDRNKELFTQKVVSRTEFETAEANYRAALADYNANVQSVNSNRFAVQNSQAGLTEANKNLERTTITSPIDGVVSLLPLKKGERVVGTAQMTGTEIMRVADMNVMEVQVDVGENDIPKVKYGDTAIIEVDAYNSRKFKGIVTQIASSSKGAATATATTTSSAEQVTSYIVHIRILVDSYRDLLDPNKPRSFPFRPGMSASVDIQTTRHSNVLSVPINAVTTRSGKADADDKKEKGKEKSEQEKKDEEADKKAAADDNAKELSEVVFVFNAADNTVKMVKVTTGIQDESFIEITSGLKAGDQVISAPYSAISRELQNGRKVKVVAKTALFESTKK
ncbi:efflux RND transporter periplasmic adaptor subunit [Chitinophaga pendula]|uniref:efflux RND transporter periplasmic adaptor subunit n=1 Tax=Chitinophaga TaxID=79328 RepID=UPI000BAF7A2F|nr:MULTISPECIES: efflux RND transporter periplasmic adaptor subunit [Chitinophaga]ASZ10581.1 efflux transporter periplasmic adaptor subunit [Chitinophaga sp. MD30]UCJ06445.1 efflux RND transporter periplasmic adaptor subunit [Chitinophaga pendula]